MTNEINAMLLNQIRTNQFLMAKAVNNGEKTVGESHHRIICEAIKTLQSNGVANAEVIKAIEAGQQDYRNTYGV